MDKRPVLNTLATGTGINLLGYAVRLFVVFFHTLLAARLYGPAHLGVYALFVAAVALLSIVSQAGMARTLVRTVSISRAAGDNASIRRALHWSLLISLPLAALVAVCMRLAAQPLAAFFGDEALVEPLSMFWLAVPALTAATLLGSFTQGFKRMFDKVFALEIVRGVLELILAVACFALGFRRWGLTFSYTLSVIVAAGLMMVFARRNLSKARIGRNNESVNSQPLTLNDLVSYSMPVWVVNMLAVSSARAPVILIGWSAGAALVGIFAVIQRLITLGTFFLISIGTMLSPMISELYDQRQEMALKQLYQSATRWTLIICMPILLYSALFAEEILALFGPVYVAGALSLTIMAIASVVSVATGPAGIVLIMAGYARLTAINESINLLVIVLGGYFLIPRFQLIGAAMSVSFAVILLSVTRVVQVWRLIGIHPYQLRLAKIAVAGGGSSIIALIFRMYAFNLDTFWFLLLGGLLMLVIYLALLVSFRLEQEDTFFLAEALRRLQATKPT